MSVGLGLDGLDPTKPAILQNVQPTLSGSANLDLDFTGGFGNTNDVTFPSVNTEIKGSWDFANGGLQSISFNHVSLNLGQFLSGVLTPVLNTIQGATRPYEPVLQALAAPLPGLSDISRFLGQGDISLLDLATVAANQTGYRELENLAESTIQLVNQINSLESQMGPNGLAIPLGDFDLGGANPDLLSQPAALDPLSTPFGTNLTNLSLGNAAQSIDVNAAIDSTPVDSSLKKSIKDFVQTLTDPTFHWGIQLPILTDPADAVFKMMLGQDATLVSLSATMNFAASSSKADGLSFAGVGLTFGGDVNVAGKFTCNYDTYGLRELVNYLDTTPSAQIDGGTIGKDILDGFYVDTNPITGTFLTLNGGVNATAGGSYGIVSVGVSGGIDTVSPITITVNDPGGGKLRFANADPSHIFTLGVSSTRA
jgi:hypothetical protein